MRRQSILLLIGLTTTALLQAPAYAGKIKCWINKDGVKECGTYVPPEYSQKRVETRNASGRVVEVEERAKTPEEIEQARIEAIRRKQMEQEAEKQRMKDRVLLNTYTSERDIFLQRDSKIAVIDGFIKVTEGNNKMLEGKLGKLQKQAGNYERKGKKPPETLLEDISIIERQMKNNNEMIDSKHGEQQAIKDQFAGYLERFRELKGIRKPLADPAEEKAKAEAEAEAKAEAEKTGKPAETEKTAKQ